MEHDHAPQWFATAVPKRIGAKTICCVAETRRPCSVGSLVSVRPVFTGRSRGVGSADTRRESRTAFAAPSSRQHRDKPIKADPERRPREGARAEGLGGLGSSD